MPPLPRWLLCLFLLPGLARAQDAVLRGVVLDAETGQPVPNAQIGVADNRLGTSANVEGRFALRVPAAYQASELEVALLGYRRYRQPLPPQPYPAELRVRLQPSPAALGEVAVTASALALVKQAVARIPQNYPVRPTRLRGFYRESDNLLSDGQYRYLIEGVLTVDKAPYTRPNDNGAVKIEASRKLDLYPDGGLGRQGWYAGPFIPHRFDFVHNRLDFINKKHFRNYQYRMLAQTTYRDRPVYAIAFGPAPGRTGADYEGKLYLDEETLAFLGAAWQRTPAGRRREGLLGFVADERAYRVEYQLSQGRYQLKSVWYNTLGKPRLGEPLRHLSEFLTTALDSSARPAPIPYPERAQFSDVFLDTPTAYDSTFWQQHTTLLPPPTLRQAVLDRERERQAQQLFGVRPASPISPASGAADSATAQLPALPARGAEAPAPAPSRPASKLGPMLHRMYFCSSLSMFDLGVEAGTLAVDLAPPGTAFRAAAEVTAPNPPAVLGWFRGYQFDLTKYLAVRLVSREVLGPYDGSGWEAGFTLAPNLRPRHRPLRLRLSAGYVRQRVARRLGRFDNPDGALRLGGTRLPAGRLGAAVQQRTEGVPLSLGLGLELSHRIDLFVDASYNLFQQSRTEIELAEESGFWLFRNTATLTPAEAGATLRFEGRPTQALPWQQRPLLVSLGLLYRLR